MPPEREDQGPEWTPYPHEPVRVRLVWRRRTILFLLLIGAFLLWLTLFKVGTEETEIVSVLNGENGPITVTRPLRPEKDYQAPDARVVVRPGMTSRSLPIEQTEQQESPDAGVPPPSSPPGGIPFLGLLLLFGPILFALWLFRRYAPPAPEVNYGIYKGALPFELITARHKGMVMTSRRVDENPFGKGRADYLADAGVNEQGVALWWAQGMPGPA